MYGWLSCDASNAPGEIGVLIPNWEPLRPMEMTEAQKSSRLDRVLSFVKFALTQDSIDTRTRIYFALRDTALVVQEELLDFAMNMCVAHERLPGDMRLARQANIAQIVDSHFSEFKRPDALLAQLLTNTRRVAVLIPDALMETHLRTICSQIRNGMVTDRAMAPPEYADLLRFAQEMDAQCALLHDSHHKNIGAELLSLVLTRPSAQFESVQHQIHQLLTRGLGEVVAETLERTCTADDLPAVLRLDALGRIIDDALANGRPAQWSEIIDPHLALAKALNDCQHNLVLRATVAAVTAGVPMGSEYTRQSQAALQTMLDMLQEVNQRMTPARMQTARQRRTKATTPPSAQSDNEVDALQSWSVERLVRWINGPVTDAAVKNPIDRQKIVARDREARRKTAPAQGHALQPAALTEADVGGMIEDALSATARFFLNDLNELSPMATALGTDEKALAACADLRGPLGLLAEQPARMDEVKARNLLQAVETAIAALRASVKQAKASTLVESRFAGQLSAALGREPMVMGKRHGGVVLCPVQPDDWTFVSTTFHRRWLPRVRSIVVDGLPMPLESDQALALYVTASSLSHYAFDVSVHLWRRRPGRSSLPGLGGGLYPPMNETDWFDTYIPCAVLHVPRAG